MLAFILILVVVNLFLTITILAFLHKIFGTFFVKQPNPQPKVLQEPFERVITYADEALHFGRDN